MPVKMPIRAHWAGETPFSHFCFDLNHQKVTMDKLGLLAIDTDTKK